MKVVFMVLLCAIAVRGAVVEGEDDEYFPHDGDTGSEVPGKLEIVTLTTEKIDCIYNSQGGDGIRFTSEKYGELGYVSVGNLRGDILVTVQHPNSQAMLVTILGWQFLILNSTIEGVRKIDDYVVPNDYALQVEDELKNDRIPDKILRGHLDHDSVNASREMAFEELLARPEIDLIRDAAFALGNTGVTGADNPAAMTFYVLAMRLTKFRDGPHNSSSGSDNRDVTDSSPKVGKRYKRWHCISSWWSSVEHCWNNGHCCNSGTCPWQSDCLGQCGPGCWWCWDFVCGDCCFHQGCHDHDLCCGAGYLTWDCAIPWGFSCSGYSC